MRDLTRYVDAPVTDMQRALRYYVNWMHQNIARSCDSDECREVAIAAFRTAECVLPLDPTTSRTGLSD